MVDNERRTLLKGMGAAAATSVVAGRAGAAVSTDVLDRQFDLDGELQESLVVFDSSDAPDRLGDLDLAEGYHVFEHLDIAWTFLRPDQLRVVADWDSVLRVKRAEELEWYNDSTSRQSMAVPDVHDNLAYVGEDAHVVVIDSGINASHPALQGRVESNWRFVDEGVGPRDPMWVDVAPTDTDTLGHGTHCAGIVGGDGTGGTQGDYTGIAPGVTLTGYTTTRSVYLPYVVSAWDHMLGRAATDPQFDPDVVSNSYGVARNMSYNPYDPVNVASWRAFEAGILPVFAQGNDGPGTGTSSRFAKAPHVLGVAAAEKSFSPDDGDNTNERPIAGFSSRGREIGGDQTEYNREQTLINLRRFHAIQDGGTDSVERGDFTGTFGAGVNSSPATAGLPVGVDEESGSSYHVLETYENVDRASLTLSYEPDGQWVRTKVYDGSGARVAVMGEEPPHQHRTLTFAVDGGSTYYIELEPELSVAGNYTLAYELQEKVDGDLSDVGPVTLFRPGISTHGVSVMSTVDRADALGNLGPAYGGSGTEPFYARLSGTSMACPAAAGIAALVYEAYRATHPDGESPSPIDVIRVLESTARDLNPTYSPANTGAGFVDATAAVRTAEDLAKGATSVGDLETGLDSLVQSPTETTPDPTVDLSVSGTRADDGSLYTGGQTNTVELTVDSIETEGVDSVAVTDSVPAGWSVIEEQSEDVLYVETNDGGRDVVGFGTVPAGETVSYFVEAPEGPAESGAYSFGPATASVDEDDVSGSHETRFGGTDDNLVVGQGTNV